MGILTFILICVGLGLVVTLIRKYVPLPDAVQTLILVAVIIVLVVLLLNALGIFGHLDYQIPKIR